MHLVQSNVWSASKYQTHAFPKCFILHGFKSNKQLSFFFFFLQVEKRPLATCLWILNCDVKGECTLDEREPLYGPGQREWLGVTFYRPWCRFSSRSRHKRTGLSVKGRLRTCHTFVSANPHFFFVLPADEVKFFWFVFAVLCSLRLGSSKMCLRGAERSEAWATFKLSKKQQQKNILPQKRWINT